MTRLAKRPKPQTRPGLLPEARLVVLPEGIASTGAPSVLAVAKTLGIELDPWQQDIVSAILAKLPDGQYAAETVAMSIPRQAGKTFLVGVFAVCYCLAHPDTTVAWTAHHNKVMLETFSSLSQIVGQARVEPHVKKVFRGAEDRSIRFTNGSRIVMASRESGSLRGVTNVGVLVLDEAQILSENALSDMLPTQNVAKNALTLMMGTPPRPKDPGEVFTQQRDNALAAVKRGEPLELAAWIEFGADPDADTDDMAQLRQANPSYPKRTPLRAIRKLRRSLSEEHFRREALGIWDDKSTPAVIPPGVWADCLDAESRALTRLVLAIDVNPERTRSSVGLAGLREDGLVHVEVDHCAEGVDWVVEWVAARCERNPIVGVVIDAKSPAASLQADFRARGVKIVTTNTDDMANACAGFFDDAASGALRHIGQEQLTRALNDARKRSIGDRWAWNRKTQDADITPVVAVTLAHWGVGSRKVKAGSLARSRSSSGRRGFVG